MGRYCRLCSYLLPKQGGVTSQIQVKNPSLRGHGTPCTYTVMITAFISYIRTTFARKLSSIMMLMMDERVLAQMNSITQLGGAGNRFGDDLVCLDCTNLPYVIGHRTQNSPDLLPNFQSLLGITRPTPSPPPPPPPMTSFRGDPSLRRRRRRRRRSDRPQLPSSSSPCIWPFRLPPCCGQPPPRPPRPRPTSWRERACGG